MRFFQPVSQLAFEAVRMLGDKGGWQEWSGKWSSSPKKAPKKEAKETKKEEHPGPVEEIEPKSAGKGKRKAVQKAEEVERAESKEIKKVKSESEDTRGLRRSSRRSQA